MLLSNPVTSLSSLPLSNHCTPPPLFYILLPSSEPPNPAFYIHLSSFLLQQSIHHARLNEPLNKSDPTSLLKILLPRLPSSLGGKWNSLPWLNKTYILITFLSWPPALSPAHSAPATSAHSHQLGAVPVWKILPPRESGCSLRHSLQVFAPKLPHGSPSLITLHGGAHHLPQSLPLASPQSNSSSQCLTLLIHYSQTESGDFCFICPRTETSVWHPGIQEIFAE